MTRVQLVPPKKDPPIMDSFLAYWWSTQQVRLYTSSLYVRKRSRQSAISLTPQTTQRTTVNTKRHEVSSRPSERASRFMEPKSDTRRINTISAIRSSMTCCLPLRRATMRKSVLRHAGLHFHNVGQKIVLCQDCARPTVGPSRVLGGNNVVSDIC